MLGETWGRWRPWVGLGGGVWTWAYMSYLQNGSTWVPYGHEGIWLHGLRGVGVVQDISSRAQGQWARTIHWLWTWACFHMVAHEYHVDMGNMIGRVLEGWGGPRYILVHMHGGNMPRRHTKFKLH